ncbi:hypothetical protein FRC08_015350 [Ceratobasidium sp. 394]|nr:hypothetical protein FRC08_015350 [Ceratobasidium sp. 394]
MSDQVHVEWGDQTYVGESASIKIWFFEVALGMVASYLAWANMERIYDLVSRHVIFGDSAFVILSLAAVSTASLSFHAYLTKRRTQAAAAVISRNMSIAETLDIIRAHGCPDITGSLKKSWSSNLFPIRRGGFGDIYQGVLNPHGEKVAIKCSRYTPPSTDEARESLKEFSRELYIWWKLRHENVIKLHGFAQFHGRVGMVSPWMANGNVMEYIGARPSVNRYCLCSQVANGLEYLHAQNIIHGDLKGVCSLGMNGHYNNLDIRLTY